MRIPLAMLAIALAMLAATGCGGGTSSSDKAKAQACNAVSDLRTQVDALKGLTPTPASVDAANTGLQKIGADLKTISDSAPKTKGNVKQQLQAANATFTAQVEQTTQSITSAGSVTAAATAIQNAGAALAKSYQDAFAGVGC
jgi:hypothetical protein